MSGFSGSMSAKWLVKTEMNIDDLSIAKKLLHDEELTLCVVKEGGTIFRSQSHGVAPFLQAIENLEGKLEGSCVADKVLGKAVALLCVYSRVRGVYGVTVSRAAKVLFQKNSVPFEYDFLVETILGLDGTSVCPFEKLVRRVSSPVGAYRMLVNACRVKGQSSSVRREET